MPELDGSELFKHIREKDRDVPVVIITGYPDTDIMARAMQYGPFLVIKKPFAINDIIAVINNLKLGAVDRTAKILKFSGEGHSLSIHSLNENRQMELAMKANVGRVNCNMPHAMANSGSWFNAQPFTDTLGCGTWAGNMTTDNINYRHFLNYTYLSVPIEEYVPGDEEIFGEYLKKWGRD